MSRSLIDSRKLSRWTGSAATPFVLAILFFFTVCMNTQSEIKTSALVVMILAGVAMIVRFRVVNRRITLPVILLGAYVLLAFVSTLYAPSGKFALQEFLKVISAFSLAMLLLALAPNKQDSSPVRWVATVLEGAAALASLISIDLLSTHILSGAVLGFFGLFTQDFTTLSMVEAGVRMTSLYDAPNVFAGCAGIGVLLSLGLVQSTEDRRTRMVHMCCLFICSFGFLLAFSMGASAAIVVGFLLYLILCRAERRGSTLVVMVETLVLAVLGAAVVSATSFQPWDGFDIVPLGLTVLGCVVLCLAERFVNGPIAQALSKRTKTVPVLICVILALIVVFGAVGCNLTGTADLNANESLRRAAYPAAGEYTLVCDYTGDVSVTIESQNQQETMMHTGTILYEGSLAEATFTVPDDSLVVYFNFYTPSGTQLREVRYESSEDSGSLPLDYKLLPGFIANRLQGLFANENAIQRTVFFADGMKLFRTSPVVGRGLGAFENGIRSVQSFAYETKYAHNHYVQVLTELGVVGLVLFVGLIVACAAGILLCRKKGLDSPMLPALGAILVFMAIHAATEVVFSFYSYLPLAFGAFALISMECGKVLPLARDEHGSGKVQAGVMAAIWAVLVIFGALLVGNMSAYESVMRFNSYQSLEEGYHSDKYEWPDYALSYIYSVQQNGLDNPELMATADQMAQRLAQLDSNSIPIELAAYYFNTGREQEAVDMLKKYVDYVSADPAAWARSFYLLFQYNSGSEVIKQGASDLNDMLNRWNEENMGDIHLTEEAAAYLAQMLGTAG